MYDNDPHTIQAEVGKVLRDPAFLARQGEQEVRKVGFVCFDSLFGQTAAGWLVITCKVSYSSSIGF